jgi:hypothetical protein
MLYTAHSNQIDPSRYWGTLPHSVLYRLFFVVGDCFTIASSVATREKVLILRVRLYPYFYVGHRDLSREADH